MSYKSTIIGFIILSSIQLFGQISLTNTAEMQIGHLPTDTNKYKSGLYNKLDIDYGYKNYRFFLGGQMYQTEFSNRNYAELTRGGINFKNKTLEIKLGNYYETLGRGLLLRSYQIPGGILEDKGFRSRHAFYRDIIGASVSGKFNNFKLKIFVGNPLNNLYPPSQSFEKRRPDQIEAIQTDYTLKGHTIGLMSMFLQNSKDKANYSGFYYHSKWGESLNYYIETVKRLDNEAFNQLLNSSSYGVYSSINFSYDKLGLSIELKKYNNLLIGSGINEPPALIKEHSYKTLNRSSHVLQPQNEQGYQVEGFYAFDMNRMLTVNHTLAINHFEKEYLFQEYFAEYSHDGFLNTDLKLFIDYAEDPFKNESKRISTGVSDGFHLFTTNYLKLEYEAQMFDREGNAVWNQVMGIQYDIYPHWIVGANSEISNDPFLVEKGKKLWLNANLSYKHNQHHIFNLFVGQRRGGPGCQAGICYEVLDFEGVELRYSYRF